MKRKKKNQTQLGNYTTKPNSIIYKIIQLLVTDLKFIISKNVNLSRSNSGSFTGLSFYLYNTA